MFALEDFIIRAKRQTYTDGDALKRDITSRPDAKEYVYEERAGNKTTAYHNTFFGSMKLIGEEIVYINKKPVWAMNYRGICKMPNLSEEVLDRVIRPALAQVGEDKRVLPLSGPSEYVSGEYRYTFESIGDMTDFKGIEKVYQDNKVIYILECHGGEIK
ncbi:MAG: DUF5680 domain-containing protein [Clostridia bacterium]